MKCIICKNGGKGQFCFPNDTRREEWLKICDLPTNCITKYLRVCFRHFRLEDVAYHGSYIKLQNRANPVKEIITSTIPIGDTIYGCKLNLWIYITLWTLSFVLQTILVFVKTVLVTSTPSFYYWIFTWHKQIFSFHISNYKFYYFTCVFALGIAFTMWLFLPKTF